MAVAALTGHGDPDLLRLLPATIAPERVALVGLHEWTGDAYPNIAAWGIESFGPDDLRQSTQPLLDWLAATGCSRVALHFDVDTIDGDEIVLGLGHPAGGLTSGQVGRTVTDVAAAADVVALTVAEFFPRQVMQLRQILEGFPLLEGALTGRGVSRTKFNARTSAEVDPSARHAAEGPRPRVPMTSVRL